jgi:hypothetical protein
MSWKIQVQTKNFLFKFQAHTNLFLNYEILSTFLSPTKSQLHTKIYLSNSNSKILVKAPFRHFKNFTHSWLIPENEFLALSKIAVYEIALGDFSKNSHRRRPWIARKSPAEKW